MREGAHGFRVVHEAVHVRYEGKRDQPGVPVDRAVHVVHVDRPVAVLDDAELDAFLLDLLVHVERRREVQLVDHDVAAAARQVHPHDDDVLAVGGVGGVGDLVGGGADQLPVALLQVLLLVGAEVDASRARAVKAVGHGLFDAARGEGAERVHRGGVHVGLERDRREVGANRGGEDGAGPGGLGAGEEPERAETASAPAPARNSRRPIVMGPPSERLGDIIRGAGAGGRCYRIAHRP